MKVLGVCVDNDPVYIIMELMPGGDLLKFLREAKMDHVRIAIEDFDALMVFLIALSSHSAPPPSRVPHC